MAHTRTKGSNLEAQEWRCHSLTVKRKGDDQMSLAGVCSSGSRMEKNDYSADLDLGFHERDS